MANLSLSFRMKQLMVMVVLFDTPSLSFPIALRRQRWNMKARGGIEDNLESSRFTRSERREQAWQSMHPEDAPNIIETKVPIEEDPLVPYVKTIARAADNRKAEGILALRVSHLASTQI